jgi:type I restriction enzyme R subunit
VVNPSQIRQVIQAMKTAVETQIFPARKETPKTLIFAKTDSHADDIIQIVREVYGQGNAFCKKVTYRAEEDADSMLSQLPQRLPPAHRRHRRHDRHRHRREAAGSAAVHARCAQQGLLRADEGPRRAQPGWRQPQAREQQRRRRQDPLRADRRRGRRKSLKTESRPLEKKPGVPLKDLLQGVAMGHRDDDTVLSLANRLVRLAKQLDDKAQARIEKASGGVPVANWARH